MMGGDSAFLALLFAAFIGNIQLSVGADKKMTICEGKSGGITCPHGSSIVIRHAQYGRSDKTTCGGPVRTTRCNSGRSMSETQKACNYKSSCTLLAQNGVYGDPCWGTYKYLSVTYSCMKADYKSLGCFKDTGSRAIPQADGRHAEVTGNYQARTQAIQKCATVAWRLGYKVFAVQNGGWCATGSDAHRTYNKYGDSSTCKADGEGGPWGNHVYWMGDKYIEKAICEGQTKSIGCAVGQYIWITEAMYGRRNRDTCPHSSIRTTSCSSGSAFDYVRRTCNLQNSCSLRALNSVFGDPCRGTYKYIQVKYECKNPRDEFKAIGCFKDTSTRAIPPMDGKHPLVTGNYQARIYAIEKCALVAKQNGNAMFGVQNGGWCASSATAQWSYDTYGKSNACRSGGKGGPWANYVYKADFTDATAIVCEGNSKTISCPNGLVIEIVAANYGRLDRLKCPSASMGSISCRASSSLHVTKQRCSGKTSCSLSATNGVYNDPCVGTYKYLTVQYKCVDPASDYKLIGCYKDTSVRAIPSAEGRNSDLSGNYQARANAIGKCGRYAAKLGYNLFAVQNGGWCATGPNAHFSYNKYGSSSACKADGEGGPWANSIYSNGIMDSTTIVCEGKTGTIKCDPGYIISIKEAVYGRSDRATCPSSSIRTTSCRAASSLDRIKDRCENKLSCTLPANNGVFGDPCGGTYKYLRVKYVCKSAVDNYKFIGCYADKSERSIPQADGRWAELKDSYQRRTDAIRKCAARAFSLGYEAFGIQNGGWCAFGANALFTYFKYGKSTACNNNGKGGAWANSVYSTGATAKTVVTCESKLKEIACDQDYYISIVAATYGRSDGTTCPGRILTKTCSSPHSLERTKSRCDGKTKCILDPTNQVYGDPCHGTYKYLKVEYKCLDIVPKYKYVACFKDTGNRAIAQADGKHPLLKDNYQARMNAIRKCAITANNLGHNMYAVQNGGWCATAKTAQYTYDKYGKSTACGKDGEGGPWANAVYYTGEEAVKDVVCEGKKKTISCPSGYTITIEDAAYGRVDRTTCPSSALKTTTCKAGVSLQRTRDRCDGRTSCILDATNGIYGDPCGGTYKYLQVKYTCKDAASDYKYIGCFKDTGVRAIPTAEGQHPDLTGSYQTRTDAIAKCARWASWKGYSVFAVQNGGWCATSSDAHFTYKKYGSATACAKDGEGGPWANAVYSNGVMDTTSTVCEGKAKSIKCPPGYIISITKAVYGRADRVTCPHSSIKTTSCTAASSLDVTREQCENKNACTMSATNRLYGDPCGGTHKYLQVTHVCKKADESYKLIGCYTDMSERAVPQLDGRYTYVKDNYISRSDAVLKCAAVARERNFEVFAVQNGGWCAGGPLALFTYFKYGKSVACKSDGEGGPWANSVYSTGATVKTKTICENNMEEIRCMPDYYISIVSAKYGRSDRNICVSGSVTNTRCSAASALELTKQRCNEKNNCFLESRNSVYGDPCRGTYKYLTVSYKCIDIVTKYKYAGCFKDTSNRAIAQADGKYPLVKDNYRARMNAIRKCATTAFQLGHNMYAVQNGGWCATAKTAQYTYDKYGKSTTCAKDGEGGPWGNAVYYTGDEAVSEEVCEGQSKAISCPAGFAIRIEEAAYGRSDRST